MSGWTSAWAILILMTIAIEGSAIMSRTPGATLSEHIWKWASIKGKGRGWRQRRFALLTGLAWLSAHLLSGGRF